MRNFKELLVWQKAHNFVLALYKLTYHFPREELYGLTSQIRRAAMSVPTNIAEGCGRDSNVEFQRFLAIALGSASEVEYQLLLAKDLGFIVAADYDRLYSMLGEVQRMLSALFQKVKEQNAAKMPKP